MLIACQNEQVTPEKISIPSVVSKYKALNKYSMQIISQLTDLQNADFALISYLNTDNVINAHNLQPVLNSGALAVFSHFEKAKLSILNNDTMEVTSPFIFPGYYFNGDAWHKENHGYSISTNWLISYSDQIFEINTQYQEPLYEVKLDAQETYYFDKSLRINWNKSTQSGNKVYISFKWYPSYSDEAFYTEFPGFDTDDSGMYLADVNILKSLKIPDYGILQVNVMRYNTSLLQKYGSNVFIANLVESSISVNIEK